MCLQKYTTAKRKKSADFANPGSARLKTMRRKISILAFLCIAIMMQSSILVSANADADYESINSQLEKDAEKYHIPGMAVIVVDKDGVLFSGTYGNCDSIDTPFIIGSMSKSFTALSILQLVQNGKIELDAPISNYIDVSDYFSEPSDGDKITVRQLLNQTGGLGTYQRFGNAKITENYGQHVYANVNYGLLGKIIEAVSGENYADYVDKNIFTPLEMSHSSATLEGSRANGLIDGYRNYFGIPVAGAPDYPNDDSWSTVPAGYLSSSASDMGRYLQMYLNGGMGIISQDGINTMFYDNVFVDGASPYFYGMGWQLSAQYSEVERKAFSTIEPVLNHAGLVENYTSNMFLFPERGIGIVVLINMNDYLVTNQLAGNMIMPLLGEPQAEVSGNPYIRNHLLYDFIYLLIFVLALYPLITIKKWQKKAKKRSLLVLDVIRHGIFPPILICLPYLLGIPMWVVWFFVKDLCIVLCTSAVLFLTGGIYKIMFLKKNLYPILRCGRDS